MVPSARPTRGFGVGTQRGTDTWHFVGSDTDTGAGPAADDALLSVALCDRFADSPAHFRPLQRLVSQRAD